jgi:hypothetical protein
MKSAKYKIDQIVKVILAYQFFSEAKAIKIKSGNKSNV